MEKSNYWFWLQVFWML